MKASEKRLEEFLSQSKTYFVIPVYQRNYDWQLPQCKEFWKDIEALVKKERDNHFLGSIVYIKGDNIKLVEEGIKEYIIIDGQQRVTTTVLFLKALHDLLSENDYDKDDIFNNYLVNKIQSGQDLKLKSIQEDQKILSKLIFDNKKDSSSSKLIQNYDFF